MASFEFTDITRGGINLKALGETGKEIRFTEIVMGDGFLPEGQDIYDLTAMINPVVRLSVTGCSLTGNDGEVEVRAPFSTANIQQGFSYRELGLIARHPDTGEGRLYCYGNAGENAEWIAPLGGASAIEKIIKIITITGRAENVTVQLKSGIYVTTEDLAAHTADPEAHMGIQDAVMEHENRISKLETQPSGLSIGYRQAAAISQNALVIDHGDEGKYTISMWAIKSGSTVITQYHIAVSGNLTQEKRLNLSYHPDYSTDWRPLYHTDVEYRMLDSNAMALDTYPLLRYGGVFWITIPAECPNGSYSITTTGVTMGWQGIENDGTTLYTAMLREPE